FEDKHDEWYWDANGDQWKQSIERVVSRIHIPRELSTSVRDDLGFKCFTGNYGGTNSDCAISDEQVEGERLITITSKRQMYPNETMTFVVGFQKNTFAVDR